MKQKLEKTIEFTLVSGLAFFIGMLVTFYKLDHRLWNENINKAGDIEIRQMNYPIKQCYTQSDIELIVYGEIK